MGEFFRLESADWHEPAGSLVGGTAASMSWQCTLVPVDQIVEMLSTPKSPTEFGMSEQLRHCIVPIVPCNDIEASTEFYGRLGFSLHSDHGSYRILSDEKGELLHLSSAPEGWVVPGRNPNGLYLYLQDVDGLADRVRDLIGGVGPESKPWGMYEFALSDPDGTLVRIGWPSGLISAKQ